MKPLIDDFTFCELSPDAFGTLFTHYQPQVFADNVAFDVRGALSESEIEATNNLRADFHPQHILRLGVYRGDQFAGWHIGVQDSWDRFYMMNTGVLPQFQRQGIYTALLPRIVAWAQEKGFQTVYSRHHASNNAVIVPKLKAGFLITGFEISDLHGLLVHLSYFFNPVRRKVLAFRTGQSLPDATVRPLLKLERTQGGGHTRH
jgi:GNAT superfamily N-acetyltransferase